MSTAAQGYAFGIVGLGVMGRNLLLNLADHGISAAGLDRDAQKVKALHAEGAGKPVAGAERAEAFIGLLRRPRAVLLLVPAGAAVDAVLAELQPLLAPGDLVIDGGNSHFKDTDARGKRLAAAGLHFFGMGISGGEAGARHGPSMMPGGPADAYEQVRPVLEAIAAKVNGEPCVAHVGSGPAGHYVKMVHNGIEYGLMQLIAETYDLMRRGLGLSNDELHAVYEDWNRGELSSFLLEITARIFLQVDERSGQRLVDLVRDVARGKGTGKWTCEEGFELQVPLPTINAAVTLRDLSAMAEERAAFARTLTGPSPRIAADRTAFLGQLRGAYHAALLVTYAQGLALLHRASRMYGYGTDLESVARIWRGGCIIRAGLLEDLRAAYRARPDLPDPLLDPHLAAQVNARQGDLRAVVGAATAAGIPALGLMGSLCYLDGYRAPSLPANLVQAQRDYFGAHTYERVDQPGTFHTRWGEG